MGQFGIGQAVRRTEDARFVTGTGRYTDDVNDPDQVHAFVLRSPHAHARIRRIDTKAARGVAGVLGVWTGADLAKKTRSNPCLVPLKNRDGKTIFIPEHMPLAADVARHVGDSVALVVAETLDQAKDAAELIEVEYEALPAIVDPVAASEGAGPAIWSALPNNIAFDVDRGDPKTVEAAFKEAAHVTRLRLVNNRVMVAPIEPRAAVAVPGKDGRTTLYVCSQNIHRMRATVAGMALIGEDKLRIVTPDVGGGFGMKIFAYGEYGLVVWASRELNRPVKWRSERQDAFVTDTGGRDNHTDVELAIDKDGRFLALRTRNVANMGAYLSNFAPFIPTDAGTPVLGSVYRFRAVHARVIGVYTNTTPIDAYRGAGRPESNYAVERGVDQAARELKIDPAELRRRNFIPKEAFPTKSGMGIPYDSGDFHKNLEDALRHAGAASFEKRRAEAKARGKLRGLGIAYYIEMTMGSPAERAAVAFKPDGTVLVTVGTQTNGQGHETAFAQVLSDRLGIPFDKIRVTQGDSDALPLGGGTGGSRSMVMAGTAITDTAEKVVAKGKRYAARVLETAEADIEFQIGRFKVVGTDRGIDLLDLAAKAREARFALAGEATQGLDSLGGVDNQSAITFPNGCHICEVEIDPDTGGTRVLAYTVVDDFGKVVNPMLVEGQVHGGVVQGLGQALLENTVFDQQSGQLLTGSFMDYAMPRADDMPSITFHRNEVPCRNNPMGIKGCGEAGTVGAAPAAINAVIDALRPLGIGSFDMPATPQRVWSAIREARRG
ncbi:MAG: xanthine dehydrogenase family protein molybdopterin-binding subunit [Alphaproteobacteria bacterium]|nr:xanthine dehydrogenase family protein molybdopterin-binding subunit [Alphaproteobacteria bacterium]